MGSLRKISYSRRLFLWLLCYSLLLVGCFVLFQYYREKQYKADELNCRLQSVNAIILSELGKHAGEDVGAVLNRIPFPEGNVRISVIDLDGDVVFDNTLDSLPSSNHLSRKEIHDAIRTGTGYTIRRHSEVSVNYYFYSAMKGGDVVVRTAIPYDLSLDDLLSADYGFLWFMFSVTALMCFVGYIATRRLGQHIGRLNDFAVKAERGERIYDTEPFSHDELGDISNHIVRLYARLQQAISDRDREHQAALHQEREKIRIKKQLTNNINHELKTPVAAIQVCLETVIGHEGLSEDKRKEFLARAYDNTWRLRRLLDDVSVITRMDDGGGSVSTERINLSEIVAEACRDYEQRALSKGVEVVIRQPEAVMIAGNGALLASIFHNLLDNALAYSGCSMIEIEVNEPSSETVDIIFRDNGSGVPEEHLQHIFERFYRIDKGRSRKMGGTGLGLSIVKNAVMFHGGAITVRNMTDGGLEFEFTLSSVRGNQAGAVDTPKDVR